MPMIERSNNKILPANSRAADVAEQAIKEITPVQQARYYNAFRPQGVQCVLYNTFHAGRKCTCNASQKQLNGRLDKQGKADPGLINQMLSGNMNFTVEEYGFGSERRQGNGNTSPQAPVNQHQGVFDIVTAGEEFPFAHTVTEPSFGDNGPVDPIASIEELVGDFDASALGFSDVSCSVCFGTGFIGGYAPFQGHRHVFSVADVELKGGAIDTMARPWRAETMGFQLRVVLPHGAIGIDCFRVMNGPNIVPCTMQIDGAPVPNFVSILAKCDGKPHLLDVTFLNPADFTHLELQFNITSESTYFEFPRLNSSSDTAMLEQLEPFQIILSPNVPNVDSMDIITESMFGKTLIVQNSNWWNSRNRSLLGWECTVRVIQPTELYRILPFRGRVMTKPPTTNKVRDNVTGPRRT